MVQSKHVTIEPQWHEVLDSFFLTDEFNSLSAQIKSEYSTKTIYPKPQDIFRAFWLTPFNDVKVVILGQDPYHGPNQAHGLSFSVLPGVKVPPSLQNIYKEIEQEFGIKKDFSDGNLEPWAKQGVFMLNAILTVVAHTPASHQKIGWELFTDEVIRQISAKREGAVFMLWGKFAQSKETLIDGDKHLILKAAHPSPFSAHNGFFGCNHFNLCNKYLESKGKSPIQW